MSNNNPNNITSKFYDIVSSSFKGDFLIAEELEIIQRHCRKGGSILDIGCGTGRHLIPLVEKGFDLTGIDSSKGMLDELKKKGKINATLIQDDFLEFEFHENKKFDLIIMFWNTFNEICLTETDALKVINKCKQLLNIGGRIIINSDNREDVDSNLFDYSSETSIDGMEINYHWETIKIYKDTNTTKSRETIQVRNLTNIEEIYETTIAQRWWSLSEYRELAKATNYSVDLVEVKQNDELYLVFAPNGQ
jgi:SAM-dependent methyltransferase